MAHGFAVPFPGAEAELARSVLDAVRRELETPVGLRSLAPSEAEYAGRFNGPAPRRDAAYHQGTIWAWLLGPYVDALLRFGGADARERALTILEGARRQLADGGLGSSARSSTATRPTIRTAAHGRHGASARCSGHGGW